jgi:cation-transporting ATPase E
MTIFCLLTKTSYPFSTNQILLLEMLIIGIPSFFLALQPNNTPIRGTFMAKLVLTSLPAAITLFINVLLCYGLNLFVDVSVELSTMCSIALTLTGFVILLRICKPFDTYKIILCCVMAAAFIAITAFVPDSFFEYMPMQLHSIFYIAILVLISYHMYSSMIALCNHLYYNKDEIIRKLKGNATEQFDDDDEFENPLSKEEEAKKEARKQNLAE